jgi:hypothetical protein
MGRWKIQKNTVWVGGAKNRHPARLQDFWSLEENQVPVREAQVKRHQRAREQHQAPGGWREGWGWGGRVEPEYWTPTPTQRTHADEQSHKVPPPTHPKVHGAWCVSSVWEKAGLVKWCGESWAHSSVSQSALLSLNIFFFPPRNISWELTAGQFFCGSWAPTGLGLRLGMSVKSSLWSSVSGQWRGHFTNWNSIIFFSLFRNQGRRRIRASLRRETLAS